MQVDLRLGIPLHLVEIRQIGVTQVGECQAAVSEVGKRRYAEQSDILQVHAEVELQAGTRAIRAGIAVEHTYGPAIVGTLGSREASHRIGTAAPDTCVVVLDPAIPVVCQATVEVEQLRVERSRLIAAPRSKVHIDLRLKFRDRRGEGRLADQPQIVDVGIVAVNRGSNRHTLFCRVAAIRRRLAYACRARHVGDEVEPVIDVDAEAEEEIPIQVEADTAIHGQIQPRHTNIEAEVEAWRIGLSEVHAELNGGTAAERQFRGYFLCLRLNGLLEFT